MTNRPSARVAKISAPTLRQRAEIIDGFLENLFPETPIPLDHVDDFTLLVAVLLSAQCTDDKVNQITPVLFARAPDPRSMSAMSVADILSIIRPLGLAPQKAAALSKMSKILTERFEGRVPRSFEELESLPGVGHKTASVVMAQAFGVPAFPVDTHIFRMAQIWRLSRAQSIAQVERDLKKCFPESRWNKLHLQIIFYGRRYCRARQCKGPECPLYSKLFPGRRTTPTYRRSP